MSTQLEQVLDEIILQKETYLIPENIKQGVTVLGVEGSLDGVGRNDILGSKLYKSIVFKNDQSSLANYFVEQVQSGHVMDIETFGFNLVESELNEKGFPTVSKVFFISTSPALIMIGNSAQSSSAADGIRYVYFNTSYTDTYIQMASDLDHSEFVTSFLERYNMTENELRELSGWYEEVNNDDVLSLEHLENAPMFNSSFVTSLYKTTLSNYLQNLENMLSFTTNYLLLSEMKFPFASLVNFTTSAADKDRYEEAYNMLIRYRFTDCTATASDIRVGKSAYTSDGIVIGTSDGTDTSDGTATDNDLAQGKIAYSKGIRLVGTGVAVDTTDADAVNTDILQGKTAYVDGQKITGTYIPLDTSDADAVNTDILQGKTAYVDGQKITGTYVPVDTTDATATASDIIRDKTAYVNGVKVTGNIDYMNGVSGSDRVDSIDDIVETSGQDGTLELRHTFDNTIAFKENYEYGIFASSSDIAQVIGLTPSKLVEGNTVLGVDGSAQLGELTPAEYETALELTEQILGNYVTQTLADEVGPVLNSVLGVTESNDEGGKISEVDAILDDIIGGDD